MTSSIYNVAQSKVGGPLHSMFQRIDKEGKGYVNKNNLDNLMKNDKSFFAGKGPTYILEKYGSDGKMTFEQFVLWWNSTYTTYNDEDIEHIVNDVKFQQSNQLVNATSNISTKFDLAVTRS
jgi:hypothetical protein